MSMYENIGMTSLDYINEIQRLQADVAKLTVENEKLLNKKAKIQWVSTKYELPKNNEEVLVWFEYFRYGEYNRLFQTWGIGEYFKNYDTWMINHETGWRDLRVIAWLPIPEPPDSEDDAE